MHGLYIYPYCIYTYIRTKTKIKLLHGASLLHRMVSCIKVYYPILDHDITQLTAKGARVNRRAANTQDR